MPATDTVTVGVPVYRGEPFIEETLNSIQGQTHQAIEVVISLDGPQPDAEELCAPFLTDARFRLITQPERLGWVGNLNWLMAHVTTPFWCYHQQDDLTDPRYLEVLVEHARSAPQGAVFFCDMEAFGALRTTFTQPSVTGSAWARQLALLYDHQAAVAFRGLTRVEALRLAGGIPPNEIESFACDTAWMAAVARWGELQRVPGYLYRKRYHAGNEHMKWFAWPVEKRSRAWVVHCAAMLGQAMLVEATVAERRTLWLAAVARLCSARTASGYLPVADWTTAQRAAMLEAFLDYVTTATAVNIPQWLEGDWDQIRQWTRSYYRQS